MTGLKKGDIRSKQVEEGGDSVKRAMSWVTYQRLRDFLRTNACHDLQAWWCEHKAIPPPALVPVMADAVELFCLPIILCQAGHLEQVRDRRVEHGTQKGSVVVLCKFEKHRLSR